MITCDQCGKELHDVDEPEPYPWVMVDGHIYCQYCMNDN